jgi:hypothetical protein
VNIHRLSAVVLAGLLFAADLHAAGHTVRLGGATLSLEFGTKKLAAALTPKLAEVQRSFDASRQALHPVKGLEGTPAYLRQDVTHLIESAGQNLNQAIEQVGKKDLVPLRAWSSDKIQRIQNQLKTPVQTAVSPLDVSAPEAVAVVASLGPLPLPAKSKPAAPKQDTVSAAMANGLLDQVGEVINRVFFLADHDDLEVTLWVGSTPEERATFRFWSEGQVQGAAPAPTIIKTNGKKKRIVRGLYDYSAAWAKGSATQVVAFPNPAGAAAAQTESEQLDLVNGTPFFCCRFDEQYCHHVDDEKQCRP